MTPKKPNNLASCAKCEKLVLPVEGRQYVANVIPYATLIKEGDDYRIIKVLPAQIHFCKWDDIRSHKERLLGAYFKSGEIVPWPSMEVLAQEKFSKPYKVACPKCKAEPPDRCKDMSIAGRKAGRENKWTHKERREYGLHVQGWELVYKAGHGQLAVKEGFIWPQLF